MRTLMQVALTVFSVTSAMSQEKTPADWTDLVAGDLKKHWTTKGNWTLDNEGVITLTPRPGEKGWSRFHAYLWSTVTYGDFDCEFEYKCEAKGNSGFYFRVGDVKNPVNTGIEVQIHDKGEKDAKPTDHTSGGVIPGVPPKKDAAKPAGEWNKMLVSVRGDQLIVTLNGEVVNEVNLNEGKLRERPKSGTIGFQDHALPIWLRNVKIRVVK